MKILMINSVCGIRSTGRICTDIADLVNKNGGDCRVAYGRLNVPSAYASIAYRIGGPYDAYVHKAQALLLGNEGFNATRATKRLVSYLEEFDPDVIHLHNLHGYYLNVEVLFDYIKRHQKRVVWTLHDCWSFTGHCAHFDRIGCKKWQSACAHCEQYRRYPAGLIDRSRSAFERKRQAFTGVERMILTPPSRWLGNLAAQSFLKDYPIRVIPNGIDTGKFKPTPGDYRERNGLVNKKIVLAVSSVWNEGKGFYDLLALEKKLPDPYVLVIVGITDKQGRELPPGIIGVERTDSVEELAQIYTAADVFVNPTYQDTYPTVNLEAQACGTPVITYRTGGSVESVPEDQIVSQGGVDAMAHLITERTGSLRLKEDLVLDKNENFAQYLALYEELMNK